MKKILASSILMIALAGAAQAQNMFANMSDSQDGRSTIVIEPLTASSDGYIAIYDHHRGEIGDLLGVASVSEGANLETRVQVGRTLRRDVIALLFVGDDFMDPSKAVDSVEIDIDN